MKQRNLDGMPDDQANAIIEKNDELSERFPRIDLNGYGLHVCDRGGEWEVWLNTEAADFDGLCIGVGPLKALAVWDAIQVLIRALSSLNCEVQGG